jgi:hypothetical protein
LCSLGGCVAWCGLGRDIGREQWAPMVRIAGFRSRGLLLRTAECYSRGADLTVEAGGGSWTCGVCHGFRLIALSGPHYMLPEPQQLPYRRHVPTGGAEGLVHEAWVSIDWAACRLLIPFLLRTENLARDSAAEPPDAVCARLVAVRGQHRSARKISEGPDENQG